MIPLSEVSPLKIISTVCSREKLLGQPMPLLQEVKDIANTATTAMNATEFLIFLFMILSLRQK